MKKVIGTLFVTAAAFVFGRFYQILRMCSEKGEYSGTLKFDNGRKRWEFRSSDNGKSCEWSWHQSGKKGKED